MSVIQIIPTVVPRSIEDIIRARERYSSFARELHIDIADGVFAKHTTWMPEEGDQLLSTDDFSYSAHLMVLSPYDAGMRTIRAGVKTLVAHLESFADEDDARRAFEMWRGENVSVGVALLLETPLAALKPILSSVDFVHLMSIETIGTQGAPFDSGIYDRVQELHVLHPELLIAIDGGVSEQNIEELVRAGARRFSVGSALAQSERSEDTYNTLKRLAESAL